uniref:Glycosyl transferase family 1 domain-containing protein n=1 Tax=viral metagenome TaxID=1070528 RepID=A0A6C0CZU9_9ZZZZ
MHIKVTLKLVMIVKNSGKVLERVLNSYIPYITSWCILDTGSTDGTQNLIISTLANLPGSLYEEPFINFRDSRNRAIELAENMSEKSDFIIMPDDSYVLYGGKQLHIILNKFKQIPQTSLQIMQITELTNINYLSTRLWKTNYGLRFKYIVHEILDTPEDTVCCIEDKNVYLLDLHDNSHVKRSSERHKKDIDLLLTEYETDPLNIRYWFYIARTYVSLENHDKAHEWYLKLANSDVDFKNNDYIFEACLNVAFYYNEKKDYKNAMFYAIESIAKSKVRNGESMFCLYKILKSRIIENEKYDYLQSLAFSMVKNAYNVEYPVKTTGFISKELYLKEIPTAYLSECIKLDNLEEAEKVLEKMKSTTNNYQKDIVPFIEIINIKKNMINSTNINTKSVNTTIKKSTVPLIVFVTDSTPFNWTPNSSNIRGSELAMVYFAEEFVKQGYEVQVFIRCTKKQESIINGVNYKRVDTFVDFINSKIEITHLIVSRTASLLKHTMLCSIKNVYLWLHDMNPQSDTFMTGANFKKFWCLSTWHIKYIKEAYGVTDNMIKIIDNGIKAEHFSPSKSISDIISSKKPMSLIYSSYEERGLNNLLNLFESLLKNYPNATLQIVCNLENKYNRDELKDVDNKKHINKIKKIAPSSISVTDSIKHEELLKLLLLTEYWIYPTNYLETFCITALEAQAAGCLCLCSDLAGLQDTVGIRGFLFKHPDINNNYVNDYLRIIDILENNKNKKIEMITNARKWALEKTYANLSKTWFTNENSNV